MTGGIVKFNDKAITSWYDHWQLGRDEKTGKRNHSEFYTLKIHIESHIDFYKESGRIDEDERYGPRKFYHIIVGDKTLEDGAWEYTGDKAGVFKGWIGFRSTRIGDPGNPHSDTFERPEGDGVTVEEDWFG